jgi:hypothetical protein
LLQTEPLGVAGAQAIGAIDAEPRGVWNCFVRGGKLSAAVKVNAGGHMQYKLKSIGALHVALGGLPDEMRVEADPDIDVSAKTVGELRRLSAWSEKLAITTPRDRDRENTVKVSKATRATRTAPKP